MTTQTATNDPNRHLAPGTPVVCTLDGEAGIVLEVCTYRRNRIDAFSYVVLTKYGREIWEVGELLVPQIEE